MHELHVSGYNCWIKLFDPKKSNFKSSLGCNLLEESSAETSLASIRRECETIIESGLNYTTLAFHIGADVAAVQDLSPTVQRLSVAMHSVTV